VRFEELTDADLAAKAPFQFPVDDDTILGVIAFMAMHESYHIGQLSAIRRQLGLPGLAG
jgi:uncharacterized damage-inducible protein DinB